MKRGVEYEVDNGFQIPNVWNANLLASQNGFAEVGS